MGKYAGYDKKFKGKKTFGQELLTSTRIYHESLMVAASCAVHGMCHVTGGGLLNFRRLSHYGSFDTPIAPPESSLDPEGRRYFAGGDVPHLQYGHGYAYVCKRSVACVLKMVKGAQVVGKVVKEPGRAREDGDNLSMEFSQNSSF